MVSIRCQRQWPGLNNGGNRQARDCTQQTTFISAFRVMTNPNNSSAMKVRLHYVLYEQVSVMQVFISFECFQRTQKYGLILKVCMNSKRMMTMR